MSVRTKNDLMAETENMEPKEELNNGKDLGQSQNGYLKDSVEETGSTNVSETDETNVGGFSEIQNGQETERTNSVFSTGDEEEDDDDLVLFNRHESFRSGRNRSVTRTTQRVCV